MRLQIKVISGRDIKPYLLTLANLRIQIFYQYPYLYEGDLDYEKKYLQRYIDCSDSILILALNENEVVGASTAIPLRFENPEMQQPFENFHIPIEEIFYLGESVLLPEYRGQGVYKHFFKEREQAAKKQGYLYTTFCAVERSPTDPRRPPTYKPLDEIWKKFGYAKNPELTTQFSWKEIGEVEESLKLMTFWIKKL